MVKYNVLGYNSFEEYLRDFRNSLLKTAHTYDYFVDWKKVENNAKKLFVELGLLNSLTVITDYSERRRMLRKIIKEHPKVIKAIPILLAIREKSVEVADFLNGIIYQSFNFQKRPTSNEEIEEMIVFCEKMKIIDLLGKIKDVYTYVFGVEVGLDTHARKNRVGEIFKNIVDRLIEKNINEINKERRLVTYRKEIELSRIIRYPGRKKVDFLIYYKGKPKIVCEANIYHTQGSKPNEIVRSYIRIHNLVKQRNLTFIWLTDGPGWLKMWEPFQEAARNIDYILNYSIARKTLNNILREIIT